jgi:hypothetical protein
MLRQQGLELGRVDTSRPESLVDAELQISPTRAVYA